jgi:phosphoglycerol transferase MdoB-like AlkP superfamily enzyme
MHQTKKRISSFLGWIKPPNTVIFFGSIFLSGVFYLALFRLGFLLKYKNLCSGIPATIILKSFVIGARFDILVISYIFIPFFIMGYLPLIGMSRLKITRIAVETILFTVFAFIFLLSLIDIEYYGEFGTHLSHWAFEYLDQMGMVFYSISSNYPVIPYLLLWGALTFIFIWWGIKLSKKIFKRVERGGIVLWILYFIFVCSLLALGARGRLGLAPFNWGVAYFSEYDFANQLALNGVYTLGTSLQDEYENAHSKSYEEFNFFPTEKAWTEVRKLVKSPNEEFVDSQNSLLRFYRPPFERNENKNYNVVIIFLESWLAGYVGALGGKPDVTPFFDSLTYRGLLFEKFFATGTRTNRGLLSVLCSFPSQTGRSLMKKFGAPRPFKSIASILKERGYQSIFVYGGDLQFDNMQGFLREVGFKRFVGQFDFPKEKSLGKWGVPDHIVLDRANEEFSKMGESPFLGVVLTLSNHEPFLLPDSSFRLFPSSVPDYKYLNTYRYSDWALGKFFSEAKKEPYFSKTIFILVADHGKVLQSQGDMPWERFHIACLFYAPAILGENPKRITTVGDQTDILPTLIGILGKPLLHQSWGKDLLSLSRENKGFAMMIDGKRIGWVEDPYFFVDRIGANHSLFNFGSDPLQKNDLSSQFPELVKKFQTKERSLLQASVEASRQKGTK